MTLDGPVLTLPREVSRGVYWLGACGEAIFNGRPIHNHYNVFLIRSSVASLLIDTGMPSIWTTVERQLDEILGDRPLDWVFPSHPELPHSGNLGKILAKYPAARVVGDVRDFHLYFPNVANRMEERFVGDSIQLGDHSFVFVDAVIRDLPSTTWGYEISQKVLFVIDGFSFLHRTGTPGDSEMPIHLPGQCALTSAELAVPIDIALAAAATRMGINESRYVDAEYTFARIEQLWRRFPPSLIAPSHGNVIATDPSTLTTFKHIYELAAQTDEADVRHVSR
jgi:flavorubredoxin